MSTSTDLYDALCTDASRLGADAGRAAASWYFDGNTPEHVYRDTLIALEEGDPAIYDTFQSSPLSGEWADSTLPRDVLAELGVDEEDDAADDYLRMYEDGFSVAYADEVERLARVQVFSVEPYAWPGGYPIGYLMDDGEYLCARCVGDASNPVHLSGNADGWKWIGQHVLEGSSADYDGEVGCSHCGAVLVEDEDDADDVRLLARAMSGRFTRKTREDGTSYTTLTDAADEWMRDVVRDAHNGMLPDDWRYDAVAAAVEFIADNEDWEDRLDEFADGCVDVYNYALSAWLSSHAVRGAYVDEAREEWGADDADLWTQLQRGQFFEAREVIGLVVSALQEHT